jgi:hypothetical protein
MPLYWVTTATAASPTAIFDAVELLEPGTGFLRVKRVCLWQTTDLGDAAEEVLRVEWIRGFTGSGSGGQTTVITPLNPFDAAATFTAELLNTTPAATGTGLSLAVMGWNIRIPLDVLYPPGEEICARGVSAQDRIVFRVSAPADAITVNCSCLVEQL